MNLCNLIAIENATKRLIFLQNRWCILLKVSRVATTFFIPSSVLSFLERYKTNNQQTDNSVVPPKMSELHKFNKKSSNFSIAHILADKTTESTPPLWSIHLIKMNSIQDKLLRVNYSNNSSIDQSNYNNYNNLVNSEVYTSSSNERIQPVNEQQCEELFHDKRKTVSRSDFSWLQCTRYQPPKIPKRTFNNRACKRKPATHPRIPFTSFQLEVLEKKYRNNAYLSKKDVHHLATILRLPHNRIKIWFQNRRARDRKEIKLNSLRKA